MSDSKPAPSKNPLAQSLLQMAGQSNVITVRRPFVAFTGTLEAAMLLDQLLYWTSRSVMGGWIAKSDQDFQDELCLTRYSVRAARDRLIELKLVETDVRRFNNFPTQHYHVLMDNLLAQWSQFVSRLSEIEQTDYSKSDSRLSEIEQTLTETTNRDYESTTATMSGEIFKVYENEIGALTPFIADAIKDAEQTYPADWIPAAVHEAAANNKRNWKYVEAVLKRWQVEGFKSAKINHSKPARNGKTSISNEDVIRSVAHAT